MTEFEMLDLIKAQCKINDKIIVRDYISFLDVLDDLSFRGCIDVRYRRDIAVITFLQDMPKNPIGIIDENDEKNKVIIEMLKRGAMVKEILKELHISTNTISQCRKYLKKRREYNDNN